MTLFELLETLDGMGLVITDLDDILLALENMGIDSETFIPMNDAEY